METKGSLNSILVVGSDSDDDKDKELLEVLTNEVSQEEPSGVSPVPEPKFSFDMLARKLFKLLNSGDEEGKVMGVIQNITLYDAQREKKDYTSAIKTLDNILEVINYAFDAPNHLALLQEKIDCLYFNQEYRSQIACSKEYLKKSPDTDNLKITFLMALSHLNLKEYNNALTLAEKCLRDDVLRSDSMKIIKQARCGYTENILSKFTPAKGKKIYATQASHQYGGVRLASKSTSVLLNAARTAFRYPNIVYINLRRFKWNLTFGRVLNAWNAFFSLRGYAATQKDYWNGKYSVDALHFTEIHKQKNSTVRQAFSKMFIEGRRVEALQKLHKELLHSSKYKAVALYLFGELKRYFNAVADVVFLSPNSYNKKYFRNQVEQSRLHRKEKVEQNRLHRKEKEGCCKPSPKLARSIATMCAPIVGLVYGPFLESTLTAMLYHSRIRIARQETAHTGLVITPMFSTSPIMYLLKLSISPFTGFVRGVTVGRKSERVRDAFSVSGHYKVWEKPKIDSLTCYGAIEKEALSEVYRNPPIHVVTTGVLLPVGIAAAILAFFRIIPKVNVLFENAGIGAGYEGLIFLGGFIVLGLIIGGVLTLKQKASPHRTSVNDMKENAFPFNDFSNLVLTDDLSARNWQVGSLKDDIGNQSCFKSVFSCANRDDSVKTEVIRTINKKVAMGEPLEFIISDGNCSSSSEVIRYAKYFFKYGADEVEFNIKYSHPSVHTPKIRRWEQFLSLRKNAIEKRGSLSKDALHLKAVIASARGKNDPQAREMLGMYCRGRAIRQLVDLYEELKNSNVPETGDLADKLNYFYKQLHKVQENDQGLDHSSKRQNEKTPLLNQV